VDGKLKSINGGGKVNKIRTATNELRDLLPDMIEQSKVLALMKKAKYDAFIEVGFTPDQAMQLLMNSYE